MEEGHESFKFVLGTVPRLGHSPKNNAGRSQFQLDLGIRAQRNEEREPSQVRKKRKMKMKSSFGKVIEGANGDGTRLRRQDQPQASSDMDLSTAGK